LREYIQQNPTFIEPETRRNETLGLINEGLLDNAISRSDSDWGIPVPDETGKVIYVWFEALINYLTETGWADGGDGYLSLWPPDLQLMGKDILPRFHATLWPAMLMALGLSLPERLYGHGWWLFRGEKISKSKGNVVEPLKVAANLQKAAGCERPYAVDALRYYMLREMPTSTDANFSIEGLEARYNADLANDLGNMVHRTLSMVHRYLNGIVPQTSLEPSIAEPFRQAVERTAQAFKETDFPIGLRAAWEMIGTVNHYYDSRAPWSLAKAGDEAGVAQVLYAGLEAARILSILVAPVMPAVAKAIAAQLQLPAVGNWSDAERSNGLPAGHRVAEPSPIFPRLQKKSESGGQSAPQPAKTKPQQMENKRMEDLITMDDFKKVKIRVARIVNAEPVPNANKLLKLTVNLGDETRTIVAGIAETYTPEQLVGKQIAMLVNLQPTAIRGIVSEGMLLAADLDGKAILLTPDHEVPEGSVVR
jgi:methionyl-tRNA synthetase